VPLGERSSFLKGERARARAVAAVLTCGAHGADRRVGYDAALLDVAEDRSGQQLDFIQKVPSAVPRKRICDCAGAGAISLGAHATVTVEILGHIIQERSWPASGSLDARSRNAGNFPCRIPSHVHYAETFVQVFAGVIRPAASWPDSPAYVGGDITAIDAWSGKPTCNGSQTTSKAANLSWQTMSIVDGTDNPSFSYPQTAMAGWLCSNIAGSQNNSAAQGEFFYEQFTNSTQTAGYSVTRIDNCSGNEGVSDGTIPQGESGYNAISQDMIAGCIKRH
jgi:hypothetical protein